MRALALRPILTRYARLLQVGGSAIGVVALILDRTWMERPVGTAALLVAVTLTRAFPVRLSKYAFLTLSAVPAICGALTVGPSSVVFSVLVATFGADALWLKKPWEVAAVNAGREVLAFVAAYGFFAAAWMALGHAGPTIELLPALLVFAVVYFLIARSLAYFTLLVRGKLSAVERKLILRWEFLVYLLAMGACVIVVAALRALEPVGWVAAALVLGMLGYLTRMMLEEAIAAEDLHKVHQMETVVASNASLADMFGKLERLASRLLEWGDLRIWRRTPNGDELVYRAEISHRPKDAPPPDTEALRREAYDTGRTVVVRSVKRDPRTLMSELDIGSIVVQPIRIGETTLGVLEVDHWKPHAFATRDVTALQTVATQVATAMHIADLRRPLLRTVGEIGRQVDALAAATESLRGSAEALTQASGEIRRAVGEQETFVAEGLEATTAIAERAEQMATQGRTAADASRMVAGEAREHQEVIGGAIERLVELKRFVSDASKLVFALGGAVKRIDAFLGTIREIADTTNVLALNAALEASRAGPEGKGFSVVADEVRELAGQSVHAADEVRRLVDDLASQVGTVIKQMVRGEEIVEGVEELSAGAAKALASISGSTGEVGAAAERIATSADRQVHDADGLAQRIGQVAWAARRARQEGDALGTRAGEALVGQGELSRALGELTGVAEQLRAITRDFAEEK